MREIQNDNLLGAFTHEYVAALMELHLARHLESTREWGNESRKYLARLTKLDGQFMQIDTRVWQAFGRRDVRAGCHRLLNRFKKTREFILQQECPSFKEVEVAFKWIEIQASETGEYAAKEAQINLYDPGGIAFIGFTQSTAMENKRRLSFDDEAPPWMFDVRFEFRDKRLDTPSQEKLAEGLARKVGNMRCSKHGQPAHVLARGRSDKFTLEISGCCKEFADAVHSKIPEL